MPLLEKRLEKARGQHWGSMTRIHRGIHRTMLKLVGGRGVYKAAEHEVFGFVFLG